MNERRTQARYRLNPPLHGRAIIPVLGQFGAQLLDVSVDGARMMLEFGSADDLARFLALGEKSIVATFARPHGAPWKFVLLHTRMTTLDGGNRDAVTGVIAGRFVAVPSFTMADLERLAAEHRAVRL